MYIPSVNSQNNTLKMREKTSNFGAVVRFNKLAKFSEVQNNVANEIESVMKKPLAVFKNETAEDYFKAKGYDFGIFSIYEHDKVNLAAFKGLEKLTVEDNPNNIAAEKKFVIGTYSDFKECNIGDVIRETEKREEKKSGSLNFPTINRVMFFVVSALIGSAVYNYNNLKNFSTGKLKPLIENIEDFYMDKPEKVLPDTVKSDTLVNDTLKIDTAKVAAKIFKGAKRV